MVGPLGGLLGDDTSFLQQVGLNVSAGQLSGGPEVDTDELTLGVQATPLLYESLMIYYTDTIVYTDTDYIYTDELNLGI